MRRRWLKRTMAAPLRRGTSWGRIASPPTPPGLSMTWADAQAMVEADDGGSLAAGHSSGRYAITPYAPGDLGEMMQLYERYNTGRPMTVRRPEHYWRSVMVRWLEVPEYPGQ